VNLRWARLHFGDGGTWDIPDPIDEWQMVEFEREWRAVHVRVEWLLTRKGRLDRALKSSVTQIVDNSPE
jgi:hypothetical protein